MILECLDFMSNYVFFARVVIECAILVESDLSLVKQTLNDSFILR